MELILKNRDKFFQLVYFIVFTLIFVSFHHQSLYFVPYIEIMVHNLYIGRFVLVVTQVLENITCILVFIKLTMSEFYIKLIGIYILRGPSCVTNNYIFSVACYDLLSYRLLCALTYIRVEIHVRYDHALAP